MSEANGALTRAAILDADDAQIIKVDVPEWDGYIHLRVLTGREFQRLEKMWTKKAQDLLKGEEDTTHALAAFLAATACDENGKLLFDKRDIKKLNEKNGVALNRLFQQAMDHNKWGVEGIEEAVGNSASAPSD